MHSKIPKQRGQGRAGRAKQYKCNFCSTFVENTLQKVYRHIRKVHRTR